MWRVGKLGGDPVPEDGRLLGESLGGRSEKHEQGDDDDASHAYLNHVERVERQRSSWRSERRILFWNVGPRMISIFERDKEGRRPLYGRSKLFQNDPEFRDRLLFYEYFHGETGEGLGASHQTGWTALVADMVLRLARHSRGQS